MITKTLNKPSLKSSILKDQLASQQKDTVLKVSASNLPTLSLF